MSKKTVATSDEGANRVSSRGEDQMQSKTETMPLSFDMQQAIKLFASYLPMPDQIQRSYDRNSMLKHHEAIVESFVRTLIKEVGND